MSKATFISDFLLYKFGVDENLPVNQQDIDEIEDEVTDHEEWAQEEGDRQDNPN